MHITSRNSKFIKFENEYYEHIYIFSSAIVTTNVKHSNNYLSLIKGHENTMHLYQTSKSLSSTVNIAYVKTLLSKGSLQYSI